MHLPTTNSEEKGVPSTVHPLTKGVPSTVHPLAKGVPPTVYPLTGGFLSHATQFGYDLMDRAVDSILLYKASSSALPVSSDVKSSDMKQMKVIANDCKTKPVSIGPPRNRKEAMVSPWWPGYFEAERIEMQSHEKNGTWSLHPRSAVPSGCPILLDRWAYDDKLAPGGTVIERFKARLTAMGCFQKQNIDFTDTYASVMATRTFRYLLQLVNSDRAHSMEHWDVSTAFIHAPLKEQVWMRQASGHEVKGKESWVCLLLKALYGTKQAAHAWQQFFFTRFC